MTNNIETAEWGEFSSTWKWVAIVLAIAIIVMWLLGFGPGGSRCASSATGEPVECAVEETAEANTAPVAELVVPEYDFKQASEAARIYFEKASAELPANTDDALSGAMDELSADADAVLVISGYHDPSGDLAFNQELAKNRALAVRDHLLAVGVASERLVMEKPFSTTGSGDEAEARRVEVALAYLR